MIYWNSNLAGFSRHHAYLGAGVLAAYHGMPPVIVAISELIGVTSLFSVLDGDTSVGGVLDGFTEIKPVLDGEAE